MAKFQQLHGLTRDSIKTVGIGVGAGIAAFGGALTVAPTAAGAQSGGAQWNANDQRASQSYPLLANATVIEALGMLGGCASGTKYSISTVQRKVVSYLTVGTPEQTLVEITPLPGCASKISAYKNAVKEITNYVYSHTPRSRVTRYWGGFMFDEEVSYGNPSGISIHGFPAASYKALDSATFKELSTAAGGPQSAQHVYGEDGTASWGSANYKSLTVDTIMAPQAYGPGQVSFINARVGSGYYENMLTINTNSGPSSYKAYSKVGPKVAGYAPVIPEWGASRWYNKWRPV